MQIKEQIAKLVRLYIQEQSLAEEVKEVKDAIKAGGGNAAIAAAVFGWVMNIVNLFGTIGSSIDAEFVLRLVGVFVAPLGAILGYF